MISIKRYLITASLFYCPFLVAQDAENTTLLKLNHNSGQYRICNKQYPVCSIERSIPLNNVINIEERASGSVIIEVHDLNRVFYEYSFGDISTKYTDNYAALKTFFDAIKKTSFGKNTALENAQKSNQQILESIQNSAANTSTHDNAINGSLQVLKNISNTVEKTLDALYAGNLDTAAEAIDAAKRLVPNGKLAIVYLKRSIAQPNVNLAKFIEGKDLTKLEERNSISALLAFIENDSEIDKLFTFIEKLDELLILKKHQKACSIGQDYPYQMCKSVELNNEKIQTVPIVVKKNDAFASFLDPSQVITFKDKTYKVHVSPKETFTFDIATGVFYDFIENYSYGTEFKDGKLVITEKDNRGSKINGMVALNVGLAKYKNELARPIAQIGLLTSEGDIGFIAGVGITAFDGKASFTFGALYKKVENLSNGLEVGGNIDSQDALKTENDYKSGLYIGVAAQF